MTKRVWPIRQLTGHGDDVSEAAKKLTKDDGSQYGLAVRNDNNQAGYYNLVYDNGGYIINEDKTKSGWDDPKTIEAMKTLEGWIKDGVMPSIETMSENGEDVLFQSGKAAMVLQAPGWLPLTEIMNIQLQTVTW